jgi:thiamine-monophosphate kinase
MGAADQRDEFNIIAKYFAPLSSGFGESFGLTDDAALIDVPPGQQLVLTKDMLVAGVHFFADDAPDLIARKLLRVNISDLAGMGATPVAYMLGFGVPRDIDESWIKGFAEGLAQDQQEFSMTLMGGDSIATPHDLTLSLTAFGLVPAGKALTRSGARPGDTLYCTGTIGDGALGLAALKGDLADPDGFLANRYLVPQPRSATGPLLQGIAHAAMDVSDGLMGDLSHIAKASGVSIRVERDSIPLSAAARDVLLQDGQYWDAIIGGGDDYELVFSAAPESAANITQIMQETGVTISRIGYCAVGEGVELLGPDGQVLPIGQAGYNHFR